MAKMTLLEIVSDIANDLDTEPVNSIDDTIESVQIAQIVKSCFFELIANRNWPHLRRTVQLDSVSDTSLPTHLKLPEGTKELCLLNYNRKKIDDLTKDIYAALKYMTPEEFISYTNRRNSTNENVLVVEDLGGVDILVMTDKQPTYFTSFDDKYIVLDSYDSSIETTVQNSNTQAVIYFDPTWSHIDSHIPDLPSEAFPLLVEEAKSTSFIVIKQQANSKAEQKARRQSAWLSRKAWRTNDGVQYPNYGRK